MASDAVVIGPDKILADLVTVDGVDRKVPIVHTGVALVSTGDVATPTSNTAAVVTYAAAGAGLSHLISGIAWSYNSAPTGGNIKIEDGSGTTVFSLDITSAGPGVLMFGPAKKGTANTAMIITLAAGGGGVTGKVSIIGHWTE